MRRKFLVISILFLTSLIIPLVYFLKFGEIKDIGHNQYLMPLSAGGDNYNQVRQIKGVWESITEYKSFPLVFLNKNDPSQNFPLYQYYNFGPYTLASLPFLIPNINPYYVLIVGYFAAIFIMVIGMYFFAGLFTSSFLKKMVAICLIIFSPYLITDIFARNAFSEVFALCLIPINIYLLAKLYQKRNLCLLALSIFFLSLFFTSHNITMLFTPIILGITFIIFWIQHKKINVKKLLPLLISGLSSLLLTSFYWVPALSTSPSLVVSATLNSPNNHLRLSSLKQLFSITPSSFSLSTTPSLCLQVGLPLIILSFLLLRKGYIAYYLILFCLAALISVGGWQFVPEIFWNIQFPYRLIPYLSLIIVFLFLQTKTKKIVGIVALILALAYGAWYMGLDYQYKPTAVSFNADFVNRWYFVNENVGCLNSIDVEMAKIDCRDKQSFEIIQNKDCFAKGYCNYEYRPPIISASIESEEDDLIFLPIFYSKYNGYYLNGNKVEAYPFLTHDLRSYSGIKLKKGTNNIFVRYEGFFIGKLILKISAILYLIGGLCLFIRKTYLHLKEAFSK